MISRSDMIPCNMVLRVKGTPGTGDFRRAAAPSSACECGSASMLPTPEATVMVQTNRRLCPFPDGGCTEQLAKAVSQSPPGSRRGGLPHHEQPGGRALCHLARGCFKLLVCADAVSGSTRPCAGPSRVRSQPVAPVAAGVARRGTVPGHLRVACQWRRRCLQGHSASAPALRRATPLRLPRARTSESAWFRSKRGLPSESAPRDAVPGHMAL
jgi:hypothetical protein